MTISDPPVRTWGELIADGDAWGYPLPDFAKALWSDLYTELKVVYWNENQEEYEYLDYDETNLSCEGVTFRRFDHTLNHPDFGPPNFVCHLRPDVEIQFYKMPHRGLESNRELTRDEWIDWYDEVLAVIRKAGT